MRYFAFGEIPVHFWGDSRLGMIWYGSIFLVISLHLSSSLLYFMSHTVLHAGTFWMCSAAAGSIFHFLVGGVLFCARGNFGSGGRACSTISAPAWLGVLVAVC